MEHKSVAKGHISEHTTIGKGKIYLRDNLVENIQRERI